MRETPRSKSHNNILVFIPVRCSQDAVTNEVHGALGRTSQIEMLVSVILGQDHSGGLGMVGSKVFQVFLALAKVRGFHGGEVFVKGSNVWIFDQHPRVSAFRGMEACHVSVLFVAAVGVILEP